MPFTLIRLGLTGAVLIFALLLIIAAGLAAMLWMPGSSFRGSLPALRADQIKLRDALQRDIAMLAAQIGERNSLRPAQLRAAADYLDTALTQARYQTRRQSYMADGERFDNIEVEITGRERPQEIVVIGGHYDSIRGGPGANDNGSGAAAVLALARLFKGHQTARTLRFVEFVNEEKPFAQTPAMGSVVYAKRCRARGEHIVAMLSLETIGYYSDAPGRQRYPSVLRLVYPSTGNFIGFVGNVSSGRLVRRAIRAFRKNASFPSEGGALPAGLPGIGWSDHWSFWQQGYRAIMVTDTAPFRYPYYHTAEDTPDKIDYERMTRVVTGLESVIADLVR